MIQKGDEVWFVTAGYSGLRETCGQPVVVQPPVRPELVRGVVTAVRYTSAAVQPSSGGPEVSCIWLDELFTDPDDAADLCAERWESICERRVKAARSNIEVVEKTIADLERQIENRRKDIEQLRITERESWK